MLRAPTVPAEASPSLPSLQVVTNDTRLYLDGEEVKNWRFEETKLDDLVCAH